MWHQTLLTRSISHSFHFNKPLCHGRKTFPHEIHTGCSQHAPNTDLASRKPLYSLQDFDKAFYLRNFTRADVPKEKKKNNVTAALCCYKAKLSACRPLVANSRRGAAGLPKPSGDRLRGRPGSRQGAGEAGPGSPSLAVCLRGPVPCAQTRRLSPGLAAGIGRRQAAPRSAASAPAGLSVSGRGRQPRGGAGGTSHRQQPPESRRGSGDKTNPAGTNAAAALPRSPP